ncbi:MAG: hypothetical protein JW902_11995 [Syntrophaceae bacterium]|nr:hypothetical protein [Syntrophaceae bacterium]
MNKKRLCLALVQCETEQEVIYILSQANLWDSDSHWRFFGDNENNFGTIGNQQSLPECALVEKIINSVDAILMKDCQLRGIEPESPNAPRSIQEALQDFYKIHNGNLISITAQERTELAKNICFVATGSNRHPNYTIIDKGEGQTPSSLPNTILSLAKSNKVRIPFVQGKFNMGGTGVFQFCGTHNIQVIVTRRHPEIVENEDNPKLNEWSFTVIRRFDPSGNFRNSVYKYLVDSDQSMPSFPATSLPLMPGAYPDAIGNEMEWGTFIKLFDYQMTGYKTNITLDLHNRLSALIPSVALPIRLMERRKGYSAHSYEANLYGINVRLEEDRQNNLEEGFPASINFAVDGQAMKGKIFAFKKGKSENYIKNEGIIFTINGQTHGFIPNAFYSRNTVGMGYLAKSLLIIIDCTAINGRAREDLFMNSRDRLRDGNLKKSIEKKLTEIVRNHPGLRELREKRRRQAIEDKISDSKPLAEILEEILKNSPTLAKLFMTGEKLSDPFNLTNKEEDREFQGKRFPSFFRLVKEFPQDAPKECHINRRFRIRYKTDVENDFFERNEDPGEFLLTSSALDDINFDINLWNGTATLSVSLPEEVAVNNLIKFQSTVSRPDALGTFQDSFYIRVLPEDENRTGPTGRRTPPPTTTDGLGALDALGLEMPHVIEVRKKDWPEYGFNNRSALKEISGGEKRFDFLVNMDNAFALTEVKNNDSIKEKILLTRFKYALVLIGLAMLKHDYDSKNDKFSEGIFDDIEETSSALSSVILPMISTLGDLEIEDEED